MFSYTIAAIKRRNSFFICIASLLVFTASCTKDLSTPAVTPPVTTLPDNDNMLMGNPTNATADSTNSDNYLMVKKYYTVSYSRTRGIPNWVSWHTQASDLGSISRQKDFRQDDALPKSWYRVTEFSYISSGFDRGHNCPSGDRTATVEANSATFLMTNMIPQAPFHNRTTWAVMEDSARELVKDGYELYTIMGSYGVGGNGDNGIKLTIDNGHVTVPSNIWKVIVALPVGDNDISRVSSATRVITVNISNSNSISANWKDYRTSVDQIEAVTNWDILSDLPVSIQQSVEGKVDDM